MDSYRNERLLKQGIINNDYIIQPPVNLGLTRQKAEKLASSLSCHDFHRLMFFTFRGLLYRVKKLGGIRVVGEFPNEGGGDAGCVAMDSRDRRVQVFRSIADNPPDPY
eukprot:1148579-Pelagomonas_calceolata.AAC.10